MKGQPVTCPAAEQLSAFGLGKLNEAAAAAIAQHLEGCPRCSKAVQGVTGDTFLKLVRAAQASPTVSPSSPTPAPTDRKLTPPQPVAPPPDLPAELAEHAKYRIRRELGHGGMGVVYQAEHIQMERLVAIKVINKSFLDHPQALKRFAQEVEAAAKLSHPNIVAAYDFEQAGDLHMLVMEFVEGQTLAEIVERKGPLPILNACHYVRQAALGLQHAHEKGMVHRDLKPQNMMLTPKGTVKLLDMGLARVASDQEGLTGTGATLGTPEYIAPEQAMDAATADIRSDIYSLGCTLYCLLGGRPPFAEGSAMQKILGHLEKEPQPLTELRPEVPAALAAVVARMMAKDPAQRYQKPVEVAQALTPFCKAGAKGVVAEPVPVAKPVTPVAAQPAPPTMAAGSSAVRWDTLTDGGNAISVLPAKKTQKVGSRPAGLAAKKKWLIGGAAAGVTLLTVIVLIGLVGLWASGVIKWKTKDGTIVLENLPADADVTVDGETVTVTPADGKTFTVRVDASKKKHRVEVKKDGFKVFGDEVEVDAGGRKSVLVRLEPKEKPADGGPTKVPVEKNPSDDPDRKAAAYVLSIGGRVRVNDEVDDIKAADLPREAFRLTYVDLRGNPKVRNAELASFQGCKNVTVLWLHETQVKDVGLAYFKDCKNLEVLRLGHKQISDAGLAHFKDCKKLRELDLNFAAKITNEGVANFKGCKDLTYLGLAITQVTNEGLANFKDCKELRELDLFNVKVDDDGLAHFKDCLNLDVVSLIGTNATDATLAQLQRYKKISMLFLEGTQVTDKGMAYLKDCRDLTKLNLAHTKVTDVGLADFKDCKKLTYLRLADTQMTDKGLAYFKNCDNLDRLEQRGSKVTKAGLDDFRKALPKCNIDIQPDQR